MKRGLLTLLTLMGVASAAGAATVSPVSYDMRNGETGSYTYFDSTYSGAGNTSINGAPLSGGLGQLTDGYIETRNWNHPAVEPPAGDGPYVGWVTFNPTITFNFGQSYDFNSATFYFDASFQGGVAPPRAVEINGQSQLVPLPPSTLPFSFTFDLTGQADTDTLVVDIFEGAGSWIFLSEVTFDANTVAPIPLPAGGMLLLTGLAGLGLARARRR